MDDGEIVVRISELNKLREKIQALNESKENSMISYGDNVNFLTDYNMEFDKNSDCGSSYGKN